MRTTLSFLPQKEEIRWAIITASPEMCKCVVIKTLLGGPERFKVGRKEEEVREEASPHLGGAWWQLCLYSPNWYGSVPSLSFFLPSFTVLLDMSLSPDLHDFAGGGSHLPV